MRRIVFGWICPLVFGGLLLPAATIGRITIVGNKKVSRDTIFFYIKAREGASYSAERLRDDFQALWATGFFSDLRFEAGPEGEVRDLTLHVSEYPLVSAVEWKTGKLKQADIEQKLQADNLTLLPYSYYSPAKIRRLQQVIRDMLREKGYSNGQVAVEENRQGEQVALTVRVESGGKTHVGKVVFPGLDTRLVSASFLRRGLKNNRVHGLLSAISARDVYAPEKMEEDLEEVRLRLQQKGFLEARVGEPVVGRENGVTIFGKVEKMVRLSIPIEMGPRYRVGKVEITGNKVVGSEFLKNFVTLRPGQVYDIKKRNKILQEMLRFYNALGYFYCQIVPGENLDPQARTADLTFQVQENEIAVLGKLEFAGNTFTRDHVIRREWLLREGNRINIHWLEDSVRRMRQLGLVTIEKMPEIRPDAKDPRRIDIKADVKEMNRQMFNFNVGYSGYDGVFVAFGYSTQNFLGLGESLGLNLQTGSRSSSYQFSFTEPYLFNLPANGGFTLFKTITELPNLFTRSSQGFNLSSSWRLGHFWGMGLNFGSERVHVYDIDPDMSAEDVYYYGVQPGKYTITSLSPTLYYSTVDSPVFPTSGSKALFTYRYSGGFLGGDISLHRGMFELVHFRPVFRRHVLGFHLSMEKLIPFGGKTVPYYERLTLGGERSIRGFPFYAIGPQGPGGTRLGGDKAFFLNLEYAIPLSNENLWLVAFADAGNAYAEKHNFNLRDIYSSVGLEMKVFIPMLNVPFRLIFAYNPRLLKQGDNHFAFRIGVGPSFN